MKHTKGEWIESKHSKGNIVEKETNRMIANCMGYSTNMDNGEHIEESYANAKLIVAAPDMLDALKSLGIILYGFRRLNKDTIRYRAAIKIEAAIKKATL